MMRTTASATAVDADVKTSLGKLLKAQSRALQASGLGTWGALAAALDEKDAADLVALTAKWNELTAALTEREKERGSAKEGQRLKALDGVHFAFEGLLLENNCGGGSTARSFHSSELSACLSLLVFIRHAG